MRAVIICHEGDKLNEEGLALWLGSFCDEVGVISIREPRRRLLARLRNEARRSGFFGLIDVVAFRFYYALRLARADRLWETSLLANIKSCFKSINLKQNLQVSDPNCSDAEIFLQSMEPDIVIARCKTMLSVGFSQSRAMALLSCTPAFARNTEIRTDAFGL